MIGRMPDFMKGDHYIKSPVERLTDDATIEEKAEFEEYKNSGYCPMEYKEEHPEMKKPYYRWNGEIVDKG